MSNRTTPSPATQPAQAGKSSMTSGQGHGQHAAIPHERIATRAYEKWCQRGCQDGAHQQDWLDAEAELRAEITGGKGSQSTVASMQQPASRPAQPAMPQKPAQRR